MCLQLTAFDAKDSRSYRDRIPNPRASLDRNAIEISRLSSIPIADNHGRNWEAGVQSQSLPITRPTRLTHDVLANIPPFWALTPSTPNSAASLSALLFRFSNNLSLRSASTCICLRSTPVNQYPKLAPKPAKTGYAHKPSLTKKGRISMPSCHNRTATPRWMTRVSDFLIAKTMVHQCLPKPLQNKILCTIMTGDEGIYEGGTRSGLFSWRENLACPEKGYVQ